MKGDITMKRYIIALICALGMSFSAKAMDYETARQQAYYLTDKMAYELNLNDAQYNDAYEINLDYFLSLRSPSDVDAIYLTQRNEDLRYIFYDWQWASFMAQEYFFRPVRWMSGAWYFPIYRYYTHSYYFYHRPRIYWDYRGGHGRHHHGGHSFYSGRRPRWDGGMRGRDHGMVGHPNGGRGGRFGGFDNRNGGRNDNFRDDRGRGEQPGRGNRPNSYGQSSDRRPNTNANPGRGGNHQNRENNYQRRGGGDMRSSSRTTVNTSRGGGHTISRSRGGGMGGNRNGSISSSNRGGSRGGGAMSGGSRGGGSSRGGGRR